MAGKSSYTIIEVDQVGTLPNLRSNRGGFGFEGTTPKYWDGTSWSTFSGVAGSDGASSWDELYDLDKSLTIDDETVTFALTNTTANGFTLTGGATATGNIIDISNSGSGYDIEGTGDTWSITAAGVIIATGLTMLDTEPITLGTSSDAVIMWKAAGVIDIEGATNFDGDMTVEAGHAVVIAGTAAAERFTITAGDVVFSDSSLTLTDADDADTVVIVNASNVSNELVRITGDAVEDGDLLYLDNGGASLTTGFYINCNDDGVSDFSVGADGATLITTAANSTKALVVTGIQTSENLVAFDNASGVIASDKAVLLLDAGGAVASGGNILRVAPTGTPNAGAIGIEFVGASKALQAMYIDADPTASSVVKVNGGGALTNGYAVLEVASDGALATGGNTLKVATAGTPASGAIYAEFDFTGITDTNENIGLKIDAGGKKVIGLHVDADPVANSVAYITSGAALAADKATLEIVAVPTTNNADSSVLRLEQTHTAGAGYIVTMVQKDVSEPFINFECAQAAGASVNSTNTTEGTTDVAYIRCAFNGTDGYITLHDTPTGT